MGIAGAALAALLVYYSANSDGAGLALAYFVAGLAVAAGTGFLLADETAAVFAAGIFLLAGAATQVYFLRRASSELVMWFVLASVGIIALLAVGDPKTSAFLAASVLIVFSALKVLQTNVLVHATIWLAGVLAGVAGLYLSLGAEFLAAIQILIYVGAVVTLFLFTVMLTIPEEEGHLEGLVLPPGVSIESVVDLEEATPRMGVGPYKGFPDTNPRKPTRSPPTLYGVSIADGVYGDESTERRKGHEQKTKEV